MADDSMKARILRMRERFEASGDRSMVAECDQRLARYGYRHTADTTVAEPAAEAAAEADVRPRRGRPPARRDV